MRKAKKNSAILLLISSICMLSGCASSHQHTFSDATCTTPKTCLECGETEGTVANHIWIDATCTKPKTCLSCGLTSGGVLSHTYSNGYCSKCYTKEPIPKINLDDVLPGTPETLTFFSNSAGGIEFNWKHNYIGNKKINYIQVTFELVDAIGNPVPDEIKGKSEHTFKLIGPFEVGRPIKFNSDVLFYCDICSKITLTNVVFEYADGSKAEFYYGWSNLVK